MRSLAYNTLLVLALVLLTPVWGIWLMLVPKIRHGFWEKLGFWPSDLLQRLNALPKEGRIWIHTVSVGELNAAKPLISALIAKEHPVILSTTTATGNRLAHQLYPTRPILYFPFDVPWVIAKALTGLNPAMIVILETEIWPNLMVQAKRRGIPVVLMNGRLSPRSFRGYARFGWFFRWVLGHYSALMMQSEGDAERMISLGVVPATVSVHGNIKFDMAPLETTPLETELRHLLGFSEGTPVLVFASTHPGEEELFLQLFQRLVSHFPDLRAVLAPRHPERADAVAALIRQHDIRFSQRSQLSRELPALAETPLILLDSIGELNALFKLATVACMGGTFVSWGGHNPLEPINAGIPVVFGPSMTNFQEIAEKVTRAEAGFQVRDIHEAEAVLHRLFTTPELYTAVVENGQTFMAENRGVTKALVAQVEACLHKQALL